ncbi:superoxide dismutase (Mn) [Haloferax gibbonsii ATCC 33959]|uniref:Superoxide dismutase n=2 Tax=Haloferax TaxID=2251 RepID=M0GWM6_HALGM|nr:superoxide dismutase [Haloferax gibbonsii]ELZ75968.1 superoxide dismutase (Mn) [Haloferax gibbonsii ATCC 33959]
MSDYELDPLPYEYDALEPHISEQVLTWHHDTHHQGYVNGWNAAEETLAISEQVLTWHHDTHHQGYVNGWNAAEETLADNREAGEFGSSAGALRNVTHNGSGHILHDLFWQNMSPEGGDEPEGALAERIAEDFGSYEAWKGEFEAAAGAAGGWALLVYDSFSNQLRNVVVDKHDQGALWGSHPILALDVWEHSYYHDYGPARGDFVSAFFEVVDWDEPAARYDQAVELFE